MAHSWTARLAFALAATQTLFATVSAQDPNPSSTSPSTTVSSESSVASASATPTQSSGPQVHLIKAGAGGFKFTPPSVSNVSIGDIITFEFYPPDHSVARAEFGSACVPYESVTSISIARLTVVDFATDTPEWTRLASGQQHNGSTRPTRYASGNMCVAEFITNVSNR
jgi:plastocyanin